MSIPGLLRGRGTRGLLALLLAVGAVVGVLEAAPSILPGRDGSSPTDAPALHGGPDAPSGRAAAPGSVLDEEGRTFERAAQTAWRYMERNRQPTGLVKATEAYGHVTTWDVASTLAGIHAAAELGLTPRSDAEAWMAEILETLGAVELYEGAVFNKSYRASDARMVGQDDEVSSEGRGWSAVDVGRLLVWLRIVAAEHPELAGAARSVVDRLDWSALVEDGQMMGATRGAGRYVEGRIGYEQYAGRGFALWDHPPERALDLAAHTEKVEVLGRPLLRDVRGDDKLTSEPFILMGMELGWSVDFRELAWRMLAVQEARYRETGQVTMLSEDALQEPPYYFYYYSVYSDGEDFVVKAQGPLEEPGPRWVSAKAAYGWHALIPTEYTWLAVQTVEPAASAGGWASGVFEESGRTTAVRNLNTAGVILEAALYRARGRPFLGGKQLAH